MTKDVILEQFGAEAESYVHSKVHAKGASLKRLVDLTEPKDSWVVLDVATGTGHTALAFAPFVKNVVASDITPEMLAQAEKLAVHRGIGNVVTETADAEALPFDDGSFDLVTCRIAPHHFGDIPAFIKESARVLRPGGVLAVVDNIVPMGTAGEYVNAFEKLRDPSHGRCLSESEWVEGFEQAGLTLLHKEKLTKKMDFGFWSQRHDVVMRGYLLAMLAETSGETAAFLQPEFGQNGISFKLAEGLFISKKSMG